jgi:hypothetical protein
VDWVSWNRTSLKNGYGYACEVNQFAEVVGHLPPMNVQGLLFSHAMPIELGTSIKILVSLIMIIKSIF